MIKIIHLVFLFMSTSLMAQNLMQERIWKISARKKSIYLDAGVFHHNSSVENAVISGIRSSATPGVGYERIVLDFNTPTVPKIYGHISSQKQKVSVDFFGKTKIQNKPQLKASKSINGIDFINIDGKSLTMEITVKRKVSFDIFYLENPGRLVIDVR